MEDRKSDSEELASKADRLMSEMLETLAQIDSNDRLIHASIEALKEKDPEPDAPLSLVEAVCLPELGGTLYKYLESEPSPTIAVKTLRLAIARGQLPTTRLNTKNTYVTRRQVKEWIASCQDIKKNPISSNVPHATAKRASSHMLQPGTSMTENRERARDAALMILRELK